MLSRRMLGRLCLFQKFPPGHCSYSYWINWTVLVLQPEKWRKKNKPIYTSKSHSIIQPKNLIDPTQFAFINNKNNDYCMIFRKCMKWKTKKNNKKLPDNIQTIEFKYLPNDFELSGIFHLRRERKKNTKQKMGNKKTQTRTKAKTK